VECVDNRLTNLVSSGFFTPTANSGSLTIRVKAITLLFPTASSYFDVELCPAVRGTELDLTGTLELLRTVRATKGYAPLRFVSHKERIFTFRGAVLSGSSASFRLGDRTATM
jgi:hypothetical protein